MSPAEERRLALIRWMRTYPGFLPVETSFLAWRCGAYGNRGSSLYPTDRCFDDLKVLEKRGLVKREGRPARWSVVS
jgi:hypothetical protein